MLKTVLVALAIAASSAMAGENDEDYKADAAIRGCASVRVLGKRIHSTTYG